MAEDEDDEEHEEGDAAAEEEGDEEVIKWTRCGEARVVEVPELTPQPLPLPSQPPVVDIRILTIFIIFTQKHKQDFR